jgi:hypothetical protein
MHFPFLSVSASTRRTRFSVFEKVLSFFPACVDEFLKNMSPSRMSGRGTWGCRLLSCSMEELLKVLGFQRLKALSPACHMGGTIWIPVSEMTYFL